MSIKILESMKDIYAAKLVNWQMEGKDENVECCLNAVHVIEAQPWRPMKIRRDFSVDIKTISVPEKFVNTEVNNWIKGYIAANEYRIWREQDYQEYLDKEGKKHRVNTKVYYICR